MKHLTAFLIATSLAASVGLVAPALSETVKKVMLTEVDPAMLPTAWRASDIIGEPIFDDQGFEIGKVKDMLVAVNGTVPFVIASTVAAADEESRNVVVSASDFELVGQKLTMHGGSAATLLALPIF